ncbi:hypothetical protein I79_002100 [Cricetulus griseus]|uniref:Uncharacterized protein n=1 Tax=Cricetulus griseus TaxID=10029 RepID=G3GWH5_CRIGR|nr:hypothetical protein I79_002100 [Cricetulus griseus]
MNTRVWRQVYVQIVRKFRGGTLLLGMILQSEFHHKACYFGLSSECKGTAERCPSGVKTAKH